jgi:hypothetical protein
MDRSKQLDASMNRSRLITILLAGVLLVGTANFGAYAANGGPLLLGKGNSATKTTKLKAAKGPALSLKTKAGTAPFAVSGSTKVDKLNADLVDGLDSAELKTRTYVVHLSAITPNQPFVYWDLPTLPKGKYVVTYSVGVKYPGSSSSIRGYFVRASGAADSGIHVVGEAVPTGGLAVVTASGYLDTTATTYRFWIQNVGNGITVPANDGTHTYPADIMFTRIDDAVEVDTTGTASATPIE